MGLVYYHPASAATNPSHRPGIKIKRRPDWASQR
jgi:hypothetical protein